MPPSKITDRQRQQREANDRCPDVERRTKIRRDHSRGHQLDCHHRRAFEHGKQVDRAAYKTVVGLRCDLPILAVALSVDARSLACGPGITDAGCSVSRQTPL